jgi:hypothetical protein
MSDGYRTPEDAARAGWSRYPAAQARVLRVEPCADPEFPGRVWVFVDTEPSHPMRASCEPVNGRWVVVSEISD